MGGKLVSLTLLAILEEPWRIQLLSVSSGIFFFISFRICCRSTLACEGGCWPLLSPTALLFAEAEEKKIRLGDKRFQKVEQRAGLWGKWRRGWLGKCTHSLSLLWLKETITVLNWWAVCPFTRKVTAFMAFFDGKSLPAPFEWQFFRIGWLSDQ